MQTIRKWLVDIRGKRTQLEVAKLCGISQNFYSCLETGERNPSVATAKEIGAALGFDWVLFYGEKQKPFTKSLTFRT